MDSLCKTTLFLKFLKFKLIHKCIKDAISPTIEENKVKNDNKEMLFLLIKSTNKKTNSSLEISSLIWHFAVVSTLSIPIKYPFRIDVNDIRGRSKTIPYNVSKVCGFFKYSWANLGTKKT